MSNKKYNQGRPYKIALKFNFSKITSKYPSKGDVMPFYDDVMPFYGDVRLP
jgi:hypothetical protein